MKASEIEELIREERDRLPAFPDLESCRLLAERISQRLPGYRVEVTLLAADDGVPYFYAVIERELFDLDMAFG